MSILLLRAHYWQSCERGLVQVPPLQKPERQSDGYVLGEQAAPAPPSAVHFLLVSLQ
jgi:hypothetical protein